ncbi:MAG: ATP-binding protein [Lachnospiraceae bacterium]|nr:ATP-binding protein [Lachnospiraceae bacterium]
MKVFNTTGVCVPEKHYMVDLAKRVQQIRKMVDAGKYFCINRSRQYGKTTTLAALRRALQDAYEVVSLDFQGLGAASFASETVFCRSFSRMLLDKGADRVVADAQIAEQLRSMGAEEGSAYGLEDLMRWIREWSLNVSRPVVLFIDEVDSATNDQVFLDFLAGLRQGYIDRDTEGVATLHSVILAGVTDVKHLKHRIREEEQHKVNSPWNIAADFDIDMSLSADGIAGMLREYEADHATGMDADAIARMIRDYTNGYPFLVSRICQYLDEKLVPEPFDSYAAAWTAQGIEEAVKMLQLERNTLFDSLSGKLINYPGIKERLRLLLMQGEPLPYNPLDDELAQMEMYGFVRRAGAQVVVANRIFETMLYNLFLDEARPANSLYADGDRDKNLFMENGRLNMRLILERFVDTYDRVFGPLEDRFKEKAGRELFLLYLKPIINGTGNYYIEAQTRDQTRTDVVVDYCGEQFVVELKIWRGNAYHTRGEKQLSEYLDHFRLDRGYMLSFNFNKNKKTGVHSVRIGDKEIIEAVV